MGQIPAKFIPIVLITVYFTNFLFNLLGGLLTRNRPRVRLMKISYTAMGVCHMLVFACTIHGTRFYSGSTMTQMLGMVSLLALLISVGTFATFFSTPSMLYTAEILPPITRVRMIPIAMSVSWLLHFLLAFTVPLMFEAIGPFTFCVFGCICGVLLLMSVAYIETVNKSEDDIEAEIYRKLYKTQTLELDEIPASITTQDQELQSVKQNEITTVVAECPPVSNNPSVMEGEVGLVFRVLGEALEQFNNSFLMRVTSHDGQVNMFENSWNLTKEEGQSETQEQTIQGQDTLQNEDEDEETVINRLNERMKSTLQDDTEITEEDFDKK